MQLIFTQLLTYIWCHKIVHLYIVSQVL